MKYSIGVHLNTSVSSDRSKEEKKFYIRIAFVKKKDKMENFNSDKKNFWQTVPGIITGIAGTLTAITGLILALNQIGFFQKNGGGNKLAASQSSLSMVNGSEKNVEDNGIQKINAEVSEVKFPPDLGSVFNNEIVYKVLNLSIDQKDDSTKSLKLKVRCIMNGTGSENVQEVNFRLSVDDALIAPSASTLNADYNDGIILKDNSSKDETILFTYPNNSKNLKLVFLRNNVKKEIALNPVQ